MEGEGALVRALAIDRVYGRGHAAVHALADVSLTVRRSELTVLRGRSGSGKTTLLNIRGGLDRPTAGQIFLDEVELTALSDADLTRVRRERIGYVFQSFGLMPLLSALENVELVLRIIGLPDKERRERAERWLEYMGLKERMKHRPFEMSGGEQQRTALARALAAEPALILADEPTGELDSKNAAQVVALLQRVTRETGVAVCMTTHDPSVVAMADVVYALADGRLVQEEQK
ncbi:MAG: ABC transporter ATP-binding protein [Mycobacterium leprae]